MNLVTLIERYSSEKNITKKQYLVLQIFSDLVNENDIRGISNIEIEAYIKEVKKIPNQFNRKKFLKGIPAKDMINYFLWPIPWKEVNLSLSTVSCFFDWCINKNIIGQNPIEGMYLKFKIKISTIQLKKLDGDKVVKSHWGSQPKNWISDFDNSAKTIEESALDYFKLKGWDGVNNENILFPDLINILGVNAGIEFRGKFLTVSSYSVDTYNLALKFNKKGEILSVVSFLENVGKLKSNIQNLTESDFTSAAKELEWFTGGMHQELFKRYNGKPDYYLFKLYEFLGCDKIINILQEKTKTGWPDLFIFKGDKFKFVEVKSPTDRLQPNQRVLIENILLKNDIDILLVKVRNK